MFTTTFSGELINVALRQLGATRIVETRNGIMYKVEFKLSDDLTVTYVFDVTKHDKYYIQRIAPYPISHGDFASADEVIEFVRRDITKFRNAMQSHNFPKFLETAHAMVRFTHAVELMFLERNIPEEDMDAVRRSIENSLDQVREIYGRTIRNKESVISAQRQHAAAQDDEKTEVHAHCQRLRLTAGMCLGFVLRGERQ